MKLTQLATLTFIALVAAPAWAYLDPGTGSILLQGLIAGLAAASLAIKAYWHRITAFFSGERTQTLQEQEQEQEIDEENESKPS